MRLLGGEWSAAALDSTIIKLRQRGEGARRNVVGQLFSRLNRCAGLLPAATSPAPSSLPSSNSP